VASVDADGHIMGDNWSVVADDENEWTIAPSTSNTWTPVSQGNNTWQRNA
jgi:hypothetical protein